MMYRIAVYQVIIYLLVAFVFWDILWVAKLDTFSLRDRFMVLWGWAVVTLLMDFFWSTID